MSVVFTDDFAGFNTGLDSPYTHAALISPSDTDDLAHASRAIIVTVDCVLKVITVGGETVTLQFLKGVTRIRVTRIYSTGSTLNAAVINALW